VHVIYSISSKLWLKMTKNQLGPNGALILVQLFIFIANYNGQ